MTDIRSVFSGVTGEYIAKFGEVDGLITVHLSDDELQLAVKLMRRALSGKRGPVSADEIGGTVPWDADS